MPPRFRLGRIPDLPALLCILLVTRIAFRSHYLYDIDSVNFTLGMRRFDPGAHQPHPPGYFLYICLGRIVDTVFQDPNTSLVAISIAASCGTLIMIYLLGDQWFGRRAARFAGLTFLFSPLGWFHGTVALTYSVEAFASSLVGYLCWRSICRPAESVLPLMLTTGLAAGFRPSSVLFLSPLILFALRRVSWKRALAGLSVLAVTLLAWGLPMLLQSGGLAAYWSALLSLWRTVPARQTVFNSSPGTSIARVVSIAGIYILCFGCGALLTLRLSGADRGNDRRKTTFTWIWVGPGLAFFSLIFLKFVNSGYLLVVSPPAFIWLGLCASRWYEGLRLPRAAKLALIATFAAANSLIFLFAPFYCSYVAVRHFEAELTGVLAALPGVASPDDTLIVGFDSHFLGYRHAGYYLPTYAVVQYPEVHLLQGIRVFSMEHGDTRLRDKLPAGRFKYFLLFPLPSDDIEYREYVNRLRAKLPAGTLRTVRSGEREFSIGAIADLPILFPLTGATSRRR